MTLQNNLNDINTAEAEVYADLELQLSNAETEYNNAIAQAEASNDFALAESLYQEKVRVQQELVNQQMQQYQMDLQNRQLAFQQQQAEIANQQWQQQFDASQQEYQDSLSAQNREYAYNLAMTMLAAGVMPDTNTLNEAGISTTEALNIRMASLTAEKSGSGGGGRSGSSGGGKSKMTLTTAKQAANAGVFSDDVLSVLRENGYTDEMLEAIYGYEPNRGVIGTSGSSFNQLYNRLSIILSEETPDNAQSLVDRLLTDDVWDSLNASEQNRIQKLLRNYGSVE